MRKHWQTLVAIASIAVGATLHAWFLITSRGVLDSGDGVQHYQIAHFSWKHPSLLLDVWGKPIFTLLASPFAQFGLNGIVLMNILLTAGMGALGWLSARKMKLPFPWLAIPLTMLHPELFRNVLSGYTETLFAFLLIACIYLISSQRHVLAALLVGLLPYSRPEAWIVLPLFVLAFLLRKQWKLLPLLLVATVIYALAGVAAGKSLLWFFMENPYTPENDIYGSGPWHHFIGSYNKTLGKVLTAGTVLGLLSLPVWLFVSKLRTKAPKLTEEILLVAGSLVGIIAAHSVMWAVGSFGSAGFLRIITCTAPCSALLTLRAISMAEPLWSKMPVRWLTVACAIATVSLNFLMWRAADRALYYPVMSSAGEQAIEQFTPRVQSHIQNAPKVIYQHPYIAYILGIDPFDEKRSMYIWGLEKEAPALNQPQGTIILWDSKFGPVEGNIPIESLLEAQHLELLDHFVPPKEVRYKEVLFEFYAFRRK